MSKWNVYLHKGDQDIYYGDLTKIAPIKKTVVIDKVRIKKSKEDYEREVIKFRNQIINGLNELLPTACLEQKTMYYYAKEM